MTVKDESFISEILGSYVPERREIAPDWANVLRRVGSREQWRLRLSRRGMLIALAAILAAMIASALALGAENDWWFLSDGMSPAPSGDVIVAATGTWDGHDWTLTAYRTSDLNTKKEELCWALTPGRLPNPHGRGASMACGPIPGSSSAYPDKISFAFTTGPEESGFPPHAYGPVVGAATHVRIELADGETFETRTIPAPAGLGLSIRFFATTLPGCLELKRVVALDDRNEVVAQSEILNSNPRLHTPQGC